MRGKPQCFMRPYKRGTAASGLVTPPYLQFAPGCTIWCVSDVYESAVTALTPCVFTGSWCEWCVRAASGRYIRPLPRRRRCRSSRSPRLSSATRGRGRAARQQTGRALIGKGVVGRAGKQRRGDSQLGITFRPVRSTKHTNHTPTVLN